MSVCLLTLAACGGEESTAELNCGRGTIERGGECVPTNDDDDDEEDTGGEDDTDDGATPDADAGPLDTGTPDVDPGTDTATGGCAEGASQCSASGVPQLCVGGVWADQAPCGPTEVCLVGLCTAGAGCTPGEVSGCLSETQQSVCNATGSAYEAVPCGDGLFCLGGVCSTQRCIPFETRCLDDFTIEVCDDSGELWNPGEVCDRRGGRVCAGGECVSGCAAVAKDSTYIGCEYWSLDLPQYEDPFTEGPEQPHSIVVGNVSDYPATITVDSFSEIAAPASIMVEPGTAASITFPRADVDIVPALGVDGTGITSRSFRVTTTEPIVAYQFNPLNNDRPLFSNDASLLLPVNAIGREYYVMGWPGGVPIPIGGGKAQRAFLTILATATGTTRVAVQTTTRVINGPGITGFNAGMTRTFELTQGQVLNLETESVFSIPPVEGDFTGTYVEGNQPIIVFAGHEQAVIGENGEDGENCCADHMEEQMYPISAWGTRYLAIHSPPRGTNPDYWRVMAAQDNTRIVTTPPIAGFHDITLNAGEFAQISTEQSFEIAGTGPILVGQYLTSQQSAGVETFTGDPSFILAVPVEGYRDDYVVLTPTGYDDDFITVIRPVGVEVVLDGTPIPASSFRTVGTLNFEYAWIPVEPGSHRLTSAEPFSISAYGYDGAVSYGFPGGLNLAQEEGSGAP